MDNFLSREDTKILKAIAVILMLAHHLWAFPDRIAGGELKHLLSFLGTSSIAYVGSFGKICVSLFFFLGGYGVYISSYGKRYDIVTHVKRLYISYWKVFFIFIPMGFLLFGDQTAYCQKEAICYIFSNFSWKEFLENFTGINFTYNSEWWFLRSYIIALVSFPIVCSIVEKCTARVNILIVIISSILVTNVLPTIGNIEAIGSLNNNYLYSKLFCQSAPYVACFWMGVVVAKDGLLKRLEESLEENKLLNPIADVLIWGFVIYFRQVGIGDAMDIFYVPVLCVVSMNFVRRFKILQKALLAIGKESTNIWLIHSFYCYYFYFFIKIVVAPRWALVSLTVLILLSYMSSVGVTYFWKKIATEVEKMKHISRKYGKEPYEEK